MCFLYWQISNDGRKVKGTGQLLEFDLISEVVLFPEKEK